MLIVNYRRTEQIEGVAMKDTSSQLDLFSVSENVSVKEIETDEEEFEVIHDLEKSSCLHPSASTKECRDCWEKNPQLWARYYTRANCVQHNRER